MENGSQPRCRDRPIEQRRPHGDRRGRTPQPNARVARTETNDPVSGVDRHRSRRHLPLADESLARPRRDDRRDQDPAPGPDPQQLLPRSDRTHRLPLIAMLPSDPPDPAGQVPSEPAQQQRRSQAQQQRRGQAQQRRPRCDPSAAFTAELQRPLGPLPDHGPEQDPQRHRLDQRGEPDSEHHHGAGDPPVPKANLGPGPADDRRQQHHDGEDPQLRAEKDRVRFDRQEHARRGPAEHPAAQFSHANGDDRAGERRGDHAAHSHRQLALTHSLSPAPEPPVVQRRLVALRGALANFTQRAADRPGRVQLIDPKTFGDDGRAGGDGEGQDGGRKREQPARRGPQCRGPQCPGPMGPRDSGLSDQG